MWKGHHLSLIEGIRKGYLFREKKKKIIIIIIIIKHLKCANSIKCSNAHDKIKNEIKRLKS